MKFKAQVEPPEPMRGLEIPPEVVEALGGGKRPTVTITLNGHTWRSRVAIMRGRYLIGLSNANRQAAGVVTGDEVEVELEFDPEPRTVAEPADLARALDADPVARAAYDRLPYGLKVQQVRSIESAKKPETRRQRIEKAIAVLRDPAWTQAMPLITFVTLAEIRHWGARSRQELADWVSKMLVLPGDDPVAATWGRLAAAAAQRGHPRPVND